MSTPLDLVTAERIKALCPAVDPDILEAVVTAAPTAFPAAGLTTAPRIAHFFAQIATETGGLKRLDENLRYTTAALLVKYWPKTFADEAAAKPYLKDPEKLANHVYGNKNGNKGGTDGWDYRGSGLIQITGRDNFRTVGAAVGMDLESDPSLARHAESALEIALGYWGVHDINAVADGTSETDVAAVTGRINSASVGLAERKANFKTALKLFSPPRAMVLAAARALATVPSGANWVSQFPTSRSLDDLDPPFREAAKGFVLAMTNAGANVKISATYRPRERAYLMHWAWQIARLGYAPSKVPPMAGVNIGWAHATDAASRKAARDMVAAYGMVNIAALNSRHTERKAVDMTISWTGTLTIRAADGTQRSISGAPRNGSNPELVAVGRGFGAVKLTSDPPHWSDDGR